MYMLKIRVGIDNTIICYPRLGTEGGSNQVILAYGPSESPPNQKRRSVEGRDIPIVCEASFNRAPFSSRATMRRGIAAAVPLSVCAKGWPLGDSALRMPLEVVLWTGR